MAQQNTTPTLSTLNSVTNVSPLEHESSPKNDISRSRLVLVHQRVKSLRSRNQVVVPTNKTQNTEKRLDMAGRLQHLKMFSRGESQVQKHDAEELKEQGLCDVIKAKFPNVSHRVFQRHELYDFIVELEQHIDMGKWSMRGNAQNLIVFASYGSVFPGLRFKKCSDGYLCKGFNYDIRLSA